MLRLLDDLVDLPADLAEHIVNQAEGIPLYAVEIVRSLVDRGLVQADGAGPRLVGSLDDLEVPPTLTALLVARLDGLPPEERTLVRDLAVLGTSFPAPPSTRSPNRRGHSSTTSSPAWCGGRSSPSSETRCLRNEASSSSHRDSCGRSSTTT